MNQLARIEPQRALTVADVKVQINTIQQVMREVMIDKVHYGVIPGCGDKPALLKPGAEKIMATFRLSADPEVEDLSSADEIRYRVRVRMLATDGTLVGVGVGECSSNEDKYKWRKAVCREEFDDTQEDRRREKWIKPYMRDPFQVKQIRTQPADVANTILKMAKKRALIDGVLTATAASDIFAQDIDEGLSDPGSSDIPVVAQPKAQGEQSASTDKIGDAPLRLIRAQLEKGGLTDTDLCKQFGIAKIEELTMDKVNAAFAWIANPNG